MTMDARPKKQLSLKQRKLAFHSIPSNQSISNPHHKSNSAIKPSQPSENVSEVTQVDQSHGSNSTSVDDSSSSSTTKALPNGLLCLPFSGLCNLGNTCYVNSVLQVLRFCPGFCEKVMEIQSLMEKGRSVSSEDQEKENDTLSNSLCKLWQKMARKEKIVLQPTNKVNTLSATKPDTFIAKLRQENELFDNKHQHDAQEMLRFLLTYLHETYLSQIPPISPSPFPTSTLSQPNAMIKLTPKKRKLPSSLEKLARPITKFLKLSSGKTKTKQKKLDSFFEPSKPIATSPSLPTTTTEKNHDFLFILDTFQGTLAYQTRCFECENTTRRSESFLDVSVPVSQSGFPGFPSLSSPVKHSSMYGSSVVGPCSLSWCLSRFALREKLRGDNKYHCDECGRFTEAERSLLFSELPAVMTIHLNRFATQAWGQSASITVNKIGGNVAIPFALSFKPWTTEDCKDRSKVYELFAVIFHCGSSCLSGHYTACVRTRECVEVAPPTYEDGKQCLDHNSWLYFDDENVELVSQRELSSFLSPLTDNVSTAYILFYTS